MVSAIFFLAVSSYLMGERNETAAVFSLINEYGHRLFQCIGEEEEYSK